MGECLSSENKIEKPTQSENLLPERVDDALDKSRKQLEMFFRISPDPAVITRASDGLITDINQRFTEVSGYSREEAIGKTSLELHLYDNPADRDKVVSIVSQLSSGLSENAEIVYQTKEGRKIIGIMSSQLISLDGVAHIYSTIRDNSNIKNIEEDLRKSEERFRTFIEQSVDGFMLVDENGIVLEWNQANERIVGITRKEIVGRPWIEIMQALLMPERRTPEIIAALKARAEEMLRTGTIPFHKQTQEARIMTRDGRSVVIQQTIFSIATPAGFRLGSINRDITESKNYEAAIVQSEQKYRDLANALPLAIYEMDLSGLITYANLRALEWFGYSEEEVVNRLYALDVITESGRKQGAQNIAKVISQGVTSSSEYLAIRKDGSTFPVMVASRPIIANDKTVGVLGTLVDLTERKQFESVVNNAQKIQALGVLAGGIAHDFNNLLTGIFGYIDLARALSKEAQIKEFLDATMGTMNRARALTMQLLTFAKGGSPVQKITPLVPFIQETAQFALSGSNTTCTFDIVENLWPCNIDKNQIGQVFDNIVINAQQAMPNGGAIEIIARNKTIQYNEHILLTTGHYVVVSIKDRGIGIPKDVLPHIFDPFYTTKTKGHGLGLATCYSIINRHGGCIDVESQPGIGTIFHVYLPASTMPVADDYANKSSHLGSGTIIVVDDEKVIQLTFEKMLESLGYSVVAKNDGREAIDFFVKETRKHRKFAAMIFDITIPGGLGGLESISEIRKLDAELPIFVASGYSDNSVMRDPAEFGFTDSISKPFSIEELSDMLNRNRVSG